MPALPVQCVREPSQASSLLDPARAEILKQLAEPDSASGVARRLGIPRQRANYHVRELEKAGLVELHEERRRGNCTERVLRAVARSYLITPDVLGSLAVDPDLVEDRLSSAYLVALAAKMIQDVAELRARAQSSGKRLPTISATSELRFASAEDRDAFAEDLLHEVAKLVREYHNDSAEGGRTYSLFLGAHPSLNSLNTESGDTA